MFVRFGGIQEYNRIPLRSVLSCLIVLLRPYTSPGAIFTTILIFFTVIMKKILSSCHCFGLWKSLFEKVVRLGAC